MSVLSQLQTISITYHNTIKKKLPREGSKIWTEKAEKFQDIHSRAFQTFPMNSLLQDNKCDLPRQVMKSVSRTNPVEQLQV